MCDVAATYLTLRLEVVERHTGVRLIDPVLPPVTPVAWHQRRAAIPGLCSWLG